MSILLPPPAVCSRFASTGTAPVRPVAPTPAPPAHPEAPARPARVTYEDDGVVAEVKPESTSLLDISLQHKVPHFRECGGRGRCTTCRVEVLDGLSNLTERTDREIELAEARGWAPSVRLACQACPTGDTRVRRLVRTPADISLLQTEALQEEPGREVEVAILSCDLRAFTPFADAHLPFDVVHVLNRVFGHLGDPILINNGVIYQYAGDQVIGLFGVDGTASAAESCLQAVRAGLGMIEALAPLNGTLADEFDHEVDIRVGAHFGKLVVGHLGHPSRRVFAAVGDAMNVTCRVETANKELGTRFLVSGALFARLPAAVEAVQHPEVVLKGKEGRHALVEICGFAGSDADLLVQTTARRLLGAGSPFGAVFYRRLFEAAPAARAMFSDPAAQEPMLTQALQVAVYGLSRFEQVAPGLAVLGRRHAGYGVQAEHYALFESVFLHAAREVLGDSFSPEVEAAWADAVGRITRAMQARGGREATKRVGGEPPL